MFGFWESSRMINYFKLILMKCKHSSFGDKNKTYLENMPWSRAWQAEVGLTPAQSP